MAKMLFFICQTYLFSSLVVAADVKLNYADYLKHSEEKLTEEIKEFTKNHRIILFKKDPDPLLVRLEEDLLMVKQMRHFIEDCRLTKRGPGGSSEFFDLVVSKYRKRIENALVSLDIDDGEDVRDFVLRLLARCDAYFDCGSENFPTNLSALFSLKFIAFSETLQKIRSRPNLMSSLQSN